MRRRAKGAAGGIEECGESCGEEGGKRDAGGEGKRGDGEQKEMDKKEEEELEEVEAEVEVEGRKYGADKGAREDGGGGVVAHVSEEGRVLHLCLLFPFP